ncbi:MAG: hypothetical protein ACKD6M_05715 [Candidatus Bathyarchaeota archaeon]
MRSCAFKIVVFLTPKNLRNFLPYSSDNSFPMIFLTIHVISSHVISDVYASISPRAIFQEEFYTFPRFRHKRFIIDYWIYEDVEST